MPTDITQHQSRSKWNLWKSVNLTKICQNERFYSEFEWYCLLSYQLLQNVSLRSQPWRNRNKSKYSTKCNIKCGYARMEHDSLSSIKWNINKRKDKSFHIITELILKPHFCVSNSVEVLLFSITQFQLK